MQHLYIVNNSKLALPRPPVYISPWKVGAGGAFANPVRAERQQPQRFRTGSRFNLPHILPKDVA